jgi:hypothetical protein
MYVGENDPKFQANKIVDDALGLLHSRYKHKSGLRKQG